MTVKVTCNCRITSYSSQSLHSYSKASSEISHYHTFIKDGDKGALQFHYHGITIFTIIFSSLLMHFFFHSPYAFLPLWSFSFALPHSLPTSCVLSLKWIFMFPYNAFFFVHDLDLLVFFSKYMNVLFHFPLLIYVPAKCIIFLFDLVYANSSNFSIWVCMVYFSGLEPNHSVC